MEQSYRSIALTRDQSTLVDADIFEKLANFKWYAYLAPNTGTFYARRNAGAGASKQVTVCLHRVIMNAAKGEIVDHISGDTLDNRRENLRIVNRFENRWNSKRKLAKTGFRGVVLNRKTGRFIATVCHMKRTLFLGSFVTPEEAGALVADAYLKLRGKFDRPR